jgi:hypothetical protein
MDKRLKIQCKFLLMMARAWFPGIDVFNDRGKTRKTINHLPQRIGDSVILDENGTDKLTARYFFDHIA